MVKNKKLLHYTIIFSVYTVLLIIIFRNTFIPSYIDSFLRLFGLKANWFVYDPSNSNPPVPNNPGGEVPTYPDPDWNEVPIVSGNYWQSFAYGAFRSIIIGLILIAVFYVVLWVIKQYDYRSKKETTLFYAIYTDKVKPKFDVIKNRVNTYLFETLKLILNKQSMITMLLIALLISGLVPQVISGLIQSMIALFVYIPQVWSVLHLRAIVYNLYDFIRSINGVDILLLLIVVYVVVSFVYAYKTYDDNELVQEEIVDKMPTGVQSVGRSGGFKTGTGQNLASASQRNAKKKMKAYLSDNESAYGRYVDFNVVRAYYNKHKKWLKNSIDCSKLADMFVNEYKIECLNIDRFLGRTPSLYEKLRWHFIGMFLIDKKRLVLSTVPMIINDRELSDEIRNDIWDLLTRRHEDVFAFEFKMTALKRTLKDLMGRVDERGNLIVTPLEELQARKVFADSNFSLEPGVTVFMPELDKDYHNSERSKIIRDGIDKLFAIFRHFIAFDNQSISHIFFDAQQTDGVANVVRGRFDYTIFIKKAEQKKSLFFVPYILYLKSRLKMWTKIREITNEYSPYKKSFFRVFIAWRAERITRWLDYFQSFNYIKISARPSDAQGEDIGEKDMTFNLNLATTYYQYASTQYQAIYQKAKEERSTFRYEHLKPWTSLDMTIADAVEIESDFVDSIIGIKRPGKEEDKKKMTEDEFKKRAKQAKVKDVKIV